MRRIEEKVAGLAGIDRIDSNARESSGSVTIEVMKNWDVKKLLDDVKSEVDRITTLPDEAEKPEVQALTRRSRLINVAVFGDAQESTIKYLTEKIKDDITNLPGITLAGSNLSFSRGLKATPCAAMSPCRPERRWNAPRRSSVASSRQRLR